MKNKKSYRIVYEYPKDEEIIKILEGIPKTFRSEFVGLAINAFKHKYDKIREELLAEGGDTKDTSSRSVSETPDLTNVF